MPDERKSFWERTKKEVSPARIALILIGAIVAAVVTGTGKPIITWASESADSLRDAVFCGGRAPEAEGDRLSTQAAADVARAQDHFREANVHYAKAYACGFTNGSRATSGGRLIR